MGYHNSVPKWPRSEGPQTIVRYDDAHNILSAFGTTVPSAVTGYALGAYFQQTDGAAGTLLYVNEGSTTSCTFVPVLSGSGGTLTGGLVVPTITASTSATVTVADSLTVGGVIVPQEIILPIELWSHASLKTRNLFYTVGIGWTVTGIVYEPDIAEGTGSVVCTVCKVTGNNVAVAATTPMCTAFAVTGTAGTPVTATLTATGADLVLATTNKIGCIFTGGDEFLDSGRGMLYIKMKRS